MLESERVVLKGSVPICLGRVSCIASLGKEA